MLTMTNTMVCHFCRFSRSRVLTKCQVVGAKSRIFSRTNSTFLQTIDQSLQLSTTNPLYQGTASLLDSVHSATGLPWWMSIVATTFCVRSLLHVPLMVVAHRGQAKLVNLKPQLDEEFKELSTKLKQAKWVYKMSDKQFLTAAAASRAKLLRQFYMKHNVHPLKGVVVSLTQLPVWILISLTLREFAGRFTNTPREDFLTEGGPWFTNLTLADPTLVLPVSLGLVTLLNIKMGKAMNPAMTSLAQRDIRMEKKVAVTMYLLSIAMVPLAAIQPSCISLYWLTSAVFSSVQNLGFAVPSVRRFLGIPQHAAEPDIHRLFKARS